MQLSWIDRGERHSLYVRATDRGFVELEHEVAGARHKTRLPIDSISKLFVAVDQAREIEVYVAKQSRLGPSVTTPDGFSH